MSKFRLARTLSLKRELPAGFDPDPLAVTGGDRDNAPAPGLKFGIVHGLDGEIAHEPAERGLREIVVVVVDPAPGGRNEAATNAYLAARFSVSLAAVRNGIAPMKECPLTP